MILRRMTHHMKAENWTNVAIEFVLVVLGVFLGIVAANWNEERIERRETEKLLHQVDAALTDFVQYIDGVQRYYDTAGSYADRAEAAWNGDPTVSDNDFVIAAYQASQITGIGTDGETWSLVFGADQLRDIDDLETRDSLAEVMTFDYTLTDLDSVASHYREEVRKLIPNELQAQIREKCGDRLIGRPALGWTLPRSCELQLEPRAVKQTANALRARKDLVSELHWHRARIANQMAQAANLKRHAANFASRVGS